MTWGGVNRYMRPLHTEKSPAADARFGERERERERERTEPRHCMHARLNSAQLKNI